MKSKTKKIIALLIIAALLLYLSAWRLDRDYPEAISAIGLDPSLGKPLLETDSRDGLYNRGVLKSLVKFSGNMEPDLLEDGRWAEYSEDGEVSQLLARVPEVEKFMPKDGRGYYILLTFNGETLEDLLEADRLNFTFAFYEIGTQRLYYSEVNL